MPLSLIIRHLIALLALCVGPLLLHAQESEKEAIKRVIMMETESYLGVDQATWASTWQQVPYAYWSFADKDGSQFINGWDNIQSTFEQYFKTQKPSKSRISYTWQEIRVYANGAYVRFQEKSDDGNRVEITDQVRMLEKKDGKWKIICMIAAVEDSE
ncbi:MAG: hypothetical protein JNN04_00840 [Cyclobacteriaceae bacterium]|nr:hypothetical protein [Cyclobacteriaceae bacterium]